MAILAAGYFVVERGMSPWFTGVLAFGGQLVNNVLLYCVGMLLRGLPWMQKWLSNRHAPFIRQRLERHIVKALTIARFGHSMLMPALVGCGSLRIPIQRVLPLVAVSGAVYVAVLLTIVVVLGQAMMRELGNWAWGIPVLLVIGAVAWIFRARYVQRDA